MRKSKKLSQRMIEIEGTVQEDRIQKKLKRAGKEEFSNARKSKGTSFLGFGDGQRWEIAKDRLKIGFLKGFLDLPSTIS